MNGGGCLGAANPFLHRLMARQACASAARGGIIDAEPIRVPQDLPYMHTSHTIRKSCVKLTLCSLETAGSFPA